MCNGKSRCGERSGVKQSGEAVCHGSVVVLSILGGIKGREASAVGSCSAGWHRTRGAPRSLEVVKCGDVLEESGVGLAGLLELVLDEVGVSYGGPKDGEALFCRGQCGGCRPKRRSLMG